MHCFQILIERNYLEKFENGITLILLSILIGIGVYNFDKLYTVATFLGLASFLILVKYILKVQWLSRFYFSYIILLLPFFIVNGILTGTGPDEPVVWYNDLENLGIRILTIPIEDFSYGMFLILLNTTIYKLLSRTKS